MTLKHLNFEQLSDLIDNELSEPQKQYCMAHITVCEICGSEYNALLKCLSMLSSLKNECITIPDFSERTLLICRSRAKKRLFIKVLPAIAASVIIIGGAVFIRTGLFNDKGSYIAANLSGQNETQRIIESVSNVNGRILQITHAYIDSEFDKSSLAAIERILHKNNIKHALIYNTAILPNPAINNLEDVSFTQGNNTYNRQGYAAIENRKVRLRIFK